MPRRLVTTSCLIRWFSLHQTSLRDMQDPVTIVGLIIFFFPFVALGIALVSGAVDFDAINSY